MAHRHGHGAARHGSRHVGPQAQARVAGDKPERAASLVKQQAVIRNQFGAVPNECVRHGGLALAALAREGQNAPRCGYRAAVQNHAAHAAENQRHNLVEEKVANAAGGRAGMGPATKGLGVLGEEESGEVRELQDVAAEAP